MIAFAVGLKLHGLRVDHCTMFQRLCAVFNSSAPVFVVKSQKLGDFSVFGGRLDGAMSPRPPMAQEIVFAMAALAIHRGDLIFGALLLTAFEGLLRTGEVLGLCGSDLLIRNGQGLCQVSKHEDLRTEGSHGNGDASTSMGHIGTSDTPGIFARKEPEICENLERHSFDFSATVLKSTVDFSGFSAVASGLIALRRGGATHLFQETLSYDLVLDKGRWSSIRAAKLYIMDGLSKLPHLSLDSESLDLISKMVPPFNPSFTHCGVRTGDRWKVSHKGLRVLVFLRDTSVGNPCRGIILR